MKINELFIAADQALLKVVDQISDEQWDMVMPDDFVSSSQEKTTLREVINYHAYDEAWVPDMLLSKTMDEVGKDKFDGDLLGSDPKASYSAIVDKAIAAAAALSDADLERPAHLSFGEYTIGEYLIQIVTFRGLRAHDLAKAIGVDKQLPSDLVQGMWDVLVPRAEEYRSYQVFGPEVAVPETAPLQDRLLGLVGQQLDNEY